MIFKGFVSIGDLTSGKVSIFDMLDLLNQYSLYLKGETFLKSRGS